MAVAEVPPYNELLWPSLDAISERGGSASISEIVETVIRRQGFSEAQQAVLHNDGPETEIGYRIAWARTYLKGMGLLTNSAQGNLGPNRCGDGVGHQPCRRQPAPGAGPSALGRATGGAAQRPQEDE